MYMCVLAEDGKEGFDALHTLLIPLSIVLLVVLAALLLFLYYICKQVCLVFLSYLINEIIKEGHIG